MTKAFFPRKVKHGWKSRIVGQNFEDLLTAFGKMQQIHVLKIPEGGKTVKIGGVLKTLRVKTPFDFALFKNGKTACIDSKTIEDGNFAYSAINRNQLLELLGVERNGTPAGYLIYFRKINKIYFFKASVLNRVQPRNSLEISDGLEIGTSEKMNLDLLFTTSV